MCWSRPRNEHFTFDFFLFSIGYKSKTVKIDKSCIKSTKIPLFLIDQDFTDRQTPVAKTEQKYKWLIAWLSLLIFSSAAPSLLEIIAVSLYGGPRPQWNWSYHDDGYRPCRRQSRTGCNKRDVYQSTRRSIVYVDILVSTDKIKKWQW